MQNEHFKYNESLGKASEKVIFRGNNYRITVLTERLIRLEYSTEGLFYDGLTENVLNRHFPVAEFKVNEDENKNGVSMIEPCQFQSSTVKYR